MDQVKIKNILIYLVIAAIILGVGYYLGAGVEKNKAKQASESMLKEIFSSISFVSNLSGKISDISSDKESLIIEVPTILGVNLPKDYQKKKIVINENTKIILRETKDIAAFEKEMAPALPYVEKEISVNDLKVGDSVNFGLQFQEGQTILTSQFTVLQIILVK